MKTRKSNTKPLLAGLAVAAVAGLVSARADYQSTVLSQGPAGYWRLNETTQPLPSPAATNIGSLAPSANGTYNNYASGGGPGPFAGSTSVGLDGGSQSVTTPWVSGLNGSAFSFEVWASPAQIPKFAYLAASAVIASPRAGWYLAQDDGSTFGAGSAWVVRFFNQNGTTPTVQYAAPVTNAPNTWVHLVLTYDGAVGALYMNGVQVTNRAAAYVPNPSAQLSIGCRSDNNFYWPGKAAEVAMYPTALTPAQVANHYNTGLSSPANYQATVQADSPVLYQRFKEAGAPSAANIGSLGSAANGAYIYAANPGVTGPTYSGLGAGNKAVNFPGSSGVVQVPALNLNTNALTISGWFKAAGTQPLGAGLVTCYSGSTVAGLTTDQQGSGLGLGFVWNNNHYGWSPYNDSGLPALPDGAWAFAALVVSPTSATLYICDEDKYANFAWASPLTATNMAVQAFAGPTLMGAVSGFPGRNFVGAMDEVTIFKRSLSTGELYTQYASAIGGVPVRIFTDLQGPTDPVPVGDTVILTIDAGGTPNLNYQWRRDGTNLATTTVGTLSVSAGAEGYNTYDVVVSNTQGSQTSQSVVVQVVTPSIPAITAANMLSRTLYKGGTLQMSITATGGGLKYQWYKNAAPIAGATTSAYVIASVTNSDAGAYSVSLSNTLGRASNGPVTVTIPVVATNSYAGAVITAAPQAWWRLDDPVGSTNLLDGMGRHDGYWVSLSNTVPPVTLGAPGAIVGDSDTATSFNPNAGGVGVVPYSPNLNSAQFTYEGWVKTAILNQYLVPYSSTYNGGGLWWMSVPYGYWSPDSVNGYYDIYGNGNTQSPMVPNAWTYLVMCWDSSRNIGGTYYPWTFFINGVTDGFVWTGSAGINTGGPVIIGGRGVNATTLADLFFNGSVDEVAVYKRVLSTTEIQAHYAARGVEIIPPSFSGTLLSQTVTSGKTVSFSTSVLGTAPIALQWFKNGAPITDATNTSLTLANVSMSDSATYLIRATNSAGTNTLSATLTVLPQTSYANVTGGSVLHLRFDGNTSDSSGRNNNGTPAGSPGYVTGIIGSQALQYTTTCVTNNGTNIAVSTASYVTFGSAPSGPPTDLRFGSGSFTVGLWVKLPASALPGDLPFIGTATNAANNPGWVLCPSYNKGGWQWCLNDGSNNIDLSGGDNSINNGQWHNFVLVVDRATALAKTYLDGILVSSRSIAGLGSIDNNNYWPMVIGQDPTGTYPEITGASATDFGAFFPPNTATLDDVGVWTRALTSAEIANVESAGRIGGRSFDTTAPSPVTLNVTPSGSGLTLTWPTGTLLQSDTLGAGAVWTTVTGATAPSYNVTPSGASKYYRVWVQ